MFKWLFAVATVVGLYYFFSDFSSLHGSDAALAITGFAGIYGLFILGFVLFSGNYDGR